MTWSFLAIQGEAGCAPLGCSGVVLVLLLQRKSLNCKGGQGRACRSLVRRFNPSPASNVADIPPWVCILWRMLTSATAMKLRFTTELFHFLALAG